MMANNPLCIFSKHLHWVGYDELGETVASLGYDGIDLTVRPGGHVEPARVEEDLPNLVERVQKAGVDVVMLTTSILSVDDPDAERILKTAAALGIPLYRPGWLVYNEAKTIEENLEAYRSQLGELADLNRSCSIRGTYQNHAGLWVGAAVWDLWLLLKQIDSEWLGCQYDIRHAVLEGANSWPIALQVIKPFINSLVVKDFAWRESGGQWEAKSVPLEEGSVDFGHFLSLLGGLENSLPICIHFEYPLGGADQGERKLSAPAEEVARAMKRDLQVFQRRLARRRDG
jgi:sugar phosphate isomerase/epimerase